MVVGALLWVVAGLFMAENSFKSAPKTVKSSVASEEPSRCDGCGKCSFVNTRAATLLGEGSDHHPHTHQGMSVKKIHPMIEQITDRTGKYVEEVATADGSTVIHLNGSFRHINVARINADGEMEVISVNEVDSL